MGSKCLISLINAEAVIFHHYLSRQGGEERLEGIQFGLSAFNQTISCCMIHKTNLINRRTLCAEQHIPEFGMVSNVESEEKFTIEVAMQSVVNVF